MIVIPVVALCPECENALANAIAQAPDARIDFFCQHREVAARATLLGGQLVRLAVTAPVTRHEFDAQRAARAEMRAAFEAQAAVQRGALN